MPRRRRLFHIQDVNPDPLCESYRHFFYHYDASPPLNVNTENLNPIACDQDFELLPGCVSNMHRKREFFTLGE